MHAVKGKAGAAVAGATGLEWIASAELAASVDAFCFARLRLLWGGVLAEPEAVSSSPGFSPLTLRRFRDVRLSNVSTFNVGSAAIVCRSFSMTPDGN